MRLLLTTLRDLWSLLDTRRRWSAAGLVLLLIVSGALEMLTMVFLFGYFAALGAAGGESGNPVVRFYLWAAGGEGADLALSAGLVLVGIFLAKNVIGLGTGFLLMRFAMKRYEYIATRLFASFINMRYDLFVRRGMMRPQQLLRSVAQVFGQSFKPALNALSDIAIFVTMALALFVILQPTLVIVAATVLGLGGALFLTFTRRLSLSLGERRMEATRLLQRRVADSFRGIIDLRIGNRQNVAINDFAEIAGEFALTDRRGRSLDMTPRALNEMLLACGIVIATLWFAREDGGLAVALSSLAVLGFAGLRMTAAMSRLANALQQMRQNQPQRELLMETLRKTAPHLLEDGRGAPAPEDYRATLRPLPEGVSGRLETSLVLKDVHFSYPDAEGPALCGVSLEVRKGHLIGICGPSGGGKSTLALLMLGLLPPDRGHVLCDGWDVFTHVDAWHANLGFVGQAPFLPTGTVRDAVTFGEPPKDVDDERVWRALELAQIAEMVRARADGLDAEIGEAGAFASGGERQRLVIARALYHDPEVLFLDEATAALDTATERAVTEAINRDSGIRTVIAIAHRISTIREADVIYVIEGGRVVASGTFDELEATSETFRRLAHGQMRAA